MGSNLQAAAVVLLEVIGDVYTDSRSQELTFQMVLTAQRVVRDEECTTT